MREQFAEEAREGLMKRTTLGAALEEYGDSLNVAAMGAIAKKSSTGEVRVIYDGSHGVKLNQGIKVRDQIRLPTSADIKAMTAEAASEGTQHFCLVYDVRKAHRRVPVLRTDWGLQACQLDGTAAATDLNRWRYGASVRTSRSRLRMVSSVCSSTVYL